MMANHGNGFMGAAKQLREKGMRARVYARGPGVLSLSQNPRQDRPAEKLRLRSVCWGLDLSVSRFSFPAINFLATRKSRGSRKSRSTLIPREQARALVRANVNARPFALSKKRFYGGSPSHTIAIRNVGLAAGRSHLRSAPDVDASVFAPGIFPT
jgi:hypothetical protein